jgi:HAD superfamily hydrolase (TIGR01509 family)
MHSWAALFDWDGVIIDSSRHHEESWERLAAEEHHVLPPGHFRRGFGMKNERIIPELLHWTTDPAAIRRLSLRKEALYREIIRERGITALPGVEPWLEALHLAGIPSVIGSSTHRENITTTLGVLGFEQYFRGIVSAEDVHHGKPDPEVFLLAAGKVGTPPARCVVFEDAHVGIEAGHRAGMKVVGVATTHPASALTGADRIVHRLDELTVAALTAWFLTAPPAASK